MRLLKNICVVDTPYALLQYLLMQPMEEIERTKFITSSILSQNITNKLPNNCLRYYGFDIRNNWRKLLNIRIRRIYEYPSIAWSKVYAQDHLRISAQVIGRHQYTLIADGPDYLNNYLLRSSPVFEEIKAVSIKDYIKNFLAFSGTIFNHEYGYNNQCVNRWVVSANDAQLLAHNNIRHTYVDMEKLWKHASIAQREFIADIFELSPDIVNKGKNADVIILTQPLREDCGLTDEEYLEIYSSEITNNSNVVIKPHPRDNFDFENYFPNVPIIRTDAPMQLLNYMGIKPKVAVTVCSTSISAMPSDVNKIMLGTKINKKIYDIYGDRFNK